MSFIVRPSKYRHVYATPWKKEVRYDNIKLGVTSSEGNSLKCNSSFFAVPWRTTGGGSLMVWPIEKQVKLPDEPGVISGHVGQINDFDLHPFTPTIVATGGDDALVKIWSVPADGLQGRLETEDLNLTGHTKRVNTVDFHPLANNLLVTSSADGVIKFWDLQNGTEALSFEKHETPISNMSWNADGSCFVSTAADTMIRICDPRANSISSEWKGHHSKKAAKALWLQSSSSANSNGANEHQIFTVGVSRMAEREYSLWDTRNTSQSMTTSTIDSGHGVLFPFFDPDNSIVYVAGKGDSNVRFYEITQDAPFVHYLSEYSSNMPQKGICWVHKTRLDVRKNEIARFLKLAGTYVETVQFQAPRKSEYFQDDIYPPTASAEQAQEAHEWLNGQQCKPQLVSMKPADMISQSEKDEEDEKNGNLRSKNKYNFKEELEKIEKSKENPQLKVFNQLCSKMDENEEDAKEEVEEEEDDEWK